MCGIDMQLSIAESFIAWAKVKIRIHASERVIYFREGEMWWASLGANIGYEQNGKHENFERPVLILRKFSRHVLWVIPLSTKLKDHTYYYHNDYDGKMYSAILIQLRLISCKRLVRRIGFFPGVHLRAIRQRIKEMI